MSLKRRDWLAWALLLLAALGWVFGRQWPLYDIVDPSTVPQKATEATTSPSTVPAVEFSGEGVPTTQTTEDPALQPQPTEPGIREAERRWGFGLCFVAAVLAGIGILALRQRVPVFGSDLLAFLLGLVFWMDHSTAWLLRWEDSVLDEIPMQVLLVFASLLALRELWGWVLEKCNPAWCLIFRLAARCQSPQRSLLVFGLGLTMSAAGLALGLVSPWLRQLGMVWCLAGFGIGLLLALLCLWRYGGDLQHSQQQLENFQQGRPITVGDGAFGGIEAKLLLVRDQQERAVQTAVTSERFKVELISNVSHDLRTPLTSILGYGELLRQEPLSPEGRERLDRLCRKAGYMNELVESLFELTKVSSGVVEAKQTEIDLIRLLEQTIGLFDDQLHSAGLVVRRHYEAPAMAVVTDGARMHQVFANLLANALKYALPGTRIHLEVGTTDRTCRVRMTNIASYEMDFRPEEIVQRFARGDKARTSRGSGLGLAIAQTYTESVGGTFRVAVDGDQFSAIVELPKTERDL